MMSGHNRFAILKDRLLFYMYTGSMYESIRKSYAASRVTSNELDNVKLSGFPRLMSPFKYTNKVLSALSILLMAQTLLIIAIEQGYVNLDSSANCYLIGRLNGLPNRLCKILSFTPFFVLTWRAFIYSIEGKLMLDAVPFALRRVSDREEGADKLEVNDAYMKKVLYIKFNPWCQHPGSKNLTKHMLRLNRTLQAKSKLNEFIILLTLVSMPIACFIAILLTLVSFWGGLADYWYLEAYPTCSPELEHLAAAGQTNYFTIHLITRHRVISAILGTAFNLVTFTDILRVLYSSVFMVLLMAYDLQKYWDAIWRKLDQLNDEYKSDQMVGKRFASTQYTSAPKYRHHSGLLHVPEQTQYFRPKTKHQNFDFDSLCENEERPKLKVQDIQRYIIDYFSLLKNYDRCVSGWLTNGCFVWLAFFGSISYISYWSQDQHFVWALRAFQLCSVMLIAGPLAFLMRVPKSARSAYPVICALMAHEQVSQSKRIWKKILEFYTTNHYGFTFLNGFQFSWLTVLQLVSYAISSIFILETHKEHSQIAALSERNGNFNY